MIAIELATILVLLFVAGFIVSKFFLRHSKKNDPFVKQLDLLFFKRKTTDKHSN